MICYMWSFCRISDINDITILLKKAMVLYFPPAGVFQVYRCRFWRGYLKMSLFHLWDSIRKLIWAWTFYKCEWLVLHPSRGSDYKKLSSGAKEKIHKLQKNFEAGEFYENDNSPLYSMYLSFPYIKSHEIFRPSTEHSKMDLCTLKKAARRLVLRKLPLCTSGRSTQTFGLLMMNLKKISFPQTTFKFIYKNS